MQHDIARLVGRTGTTTASTLLRSVDPHTIGRWVRQGRLLRPYPGVLVLPDRQDDWRTRSSAAALATGGVLSHRTRSPSGGCCPRQDRCTCRSLRDDARSTAQASSSSGWAI